MCRHIAYLGPPVALGEVLVSPAHGLVRQSWEPRHQRYGTVNADGFGVGWYADGDPVPGRYRRSGPVWGDETFADLARVVRSTALLAAVRDATFAGADGDAAAAPFAEGRLLFSHNGAVHGWPGSLAQLAGDLPPERMLALAARSDSALIWALVLHRVAQGDEIARAVAETVRDVGAAAPGSRLNLLLTDGSAIVATAWGDSLWYLHEPGRRTVVASEPYDDDPYWREVPDRTLLAATRTDVLLTPLKEPTA
ncbi:MULTISPECIES: ergothioneine biosynthesis protein EgtC [Streptomyces]|uniref:Gamma-glutamyl-hercynylcysteine sulfoxide hydrolase n=2 Tax=Streptomyces TaxID=1883 RepID=A0A652LBF7_9ACTN|nr:MULTISPECIES: ergothioneine biosynthesis protein EgtC [unclassified Streptomyces]WSS65890.1 ergothioneine biosynthesis protein EgtC [Streptomyces sp. NBC_01177]WSS72882.1 ergothioneine biosynthesis protein EgtC [Streptomyces sp. NBC_01175]WSS79922.1 ergothioneine biosynthesis protein EgtC [Streptomyces sp. NBC_01174]MDX3324931.1 ergothioneine biosynthesis protein EgtC [Streptomyces sp. ME02-6979-3A]MDX3685533.1 ergothioneine biosynthesis protein EgtC [Streptomyces sp. AK04-4c]